jgi:hypothetical protein
MKPRVLDLEAYTGRSPGEWDEAERRPAGGGGAVIVYLAVACAALFGWIVWQLCIHPGWKAVRP